MFVFMKVIWKYQLSNLPVEVVPLPMISTFLSLRMQEGFVTLWYEVNPANTNTKQKKFYVVMTGNIVPDDAEYLGTVEQPHTGVVAHIYAEE